MGKYIIKGINEKGENISLKLFFSSEEELNNFLKTKKIIPVSIKESRSILSFMGQRITDLELSLVLFQLGMMHKKGVPLNDCFDILIDQTEKPFLKKIFNDIKNDIEKGFTLSKALSNYDLIPNFIVEMVKVGEASGNIDEILISASRYIERRSELKNRFITALIYPSIVLLVGLIAVMVIAVFVTPKITTIYANFGKPLPLELLVVDNLSKWLLWVFKLSPIWIFLIFWYYRKYVKGRLGEMVLSKIPFVKTIYDEISLTSFAYVLGMLLKGGVQLEKAFDMGSEVIKGNRYYLHLKNIAQKIFIGTSLRVALVKESVFPEDFIKLFATGDEVGNVEDMAELVAQIYEKNASRKIAILLAYLEPAIVIFLAILVGGFIMATLLPILNLSLK
ncbi:MAG: type II secretion system F family protein [Calditerrivibrio sp.]|nr:type II secretion system F family protein [Calditerrivibrio sp.]